MRKTKGLPSPHREIRYSRAVHHVCRSDPGVEVKKVRLRESRKHLRTLNAYFVAKKYRQRVAILPIQVPISEIKSSTNADRLSLGENY